DKTEPKLGCRLRLLHGSRVQKHEHHISHSRYLQTQNPKTSQQKSKAYKHLRNSRETLTRQ
ncbi:hypothetical protein CARUB_v10027493mg, partial [Capsella rubella]